MEAALDAWAAFGVPGAPEPAAALPPNPLARLWGAHRLNSPKRVARQWCLQCCPGGTNGPFACAEEVILWLEADLQLS